MDTYKQFYEDMTAGGASSVFGSVNSGSTGNQFPSSGDRGYAPGDARIPTVLGAKKRKGKKKKSKILIQRRNLFENTNPRLGRCYELAGKHVSDGMFIPDREKSILVHGRLINPFGVGYPELDHAWVETGDKVYDPVMDQTWDKEAFYALFKPTIHNQYNRKQLHKKIMKHKHWGPWE